MKSVSNFLRAALPLCASLLAIPGLHAQITATAPAATGTENPQRFDLFGGVAYTHFNPGYAHQVRATNLVGWQGSATAWLARSYGLEATARGAYGSFPLPASATNADANLTGNENISEHLFLFGPTFRMVHNEKYTAGAHVLIGGAYGSFDNAFSGTGITPASVGLYDNQLALAYAIGGWADYNLTNISPKLAIRVVGDYQPTRYGGTQQNEFFGTVGVVYKIGARGR